MTEFDCRAPEFEYRAPELDGGASRSAVPSYATAPAFVLTPERLRS